MKTITVQDLDKKLKRGEDIVLVDVRELYEHDQFNLGGLLIPLPGIFEKVELIPKDRPVILYCKKGIRSQIAIQRLEQRFGFDNLINLTGGINAWLSEFNDETLKPDH